MENQDKMEFFKQLQTSIDGVIKSGEMLKKLWTDGNCRLREDEIELIDKEMVELGKVVSIVNTETDKFKRVNEVK